MSAEESKGRAKAPAAETATDAVELAQGVAAAAPQGVELPPAGEASADENGAATEAPPPPGGSAVEWFAGAQLRVRALPEQGFRRAGRFWPPGEGVTIAADDFSAAQIEQLFGERQLVVSLVPWNAADGGRE